MVRLTMVLAAACLSSVVAVTTAPVAVAKPYGEVGRFGGYNMAGSPTASEEGKLVEPVGFAVERDAGSEENDLYILDRTNFVKNEVSATDELQYRLEKISSGGNMLAHTAFTVDFKERKHYEDAHPLIGLALDPKTERVYAVVESMPHVGSQRVPVAGWLVAWSTKTLDKPAGLAEGPVKGAGVVAELAGGEPSEPLTGEGLELKKPASEDLYLPQAIVVDEASGDVVVEAQHGVQSGVGGPLVLAKIETNDPTASEPIQEEWVAEASNIAPNSEIGGGLFAPSSSGGEFGVALWSNSATDEAARLGVVGSTLKATQGALLDADSAAHGKELATAPMVELLRQPPNGSSKPESGALATNAAGSAVTQVSGGASPVYAAIYAQEVGGLINDDETSTKAWEALGHEGDNPLNPFWIAGAAEDDEWGNVGIRLFESKSGETIILDTVGGGDPKVAPWEGPQELAGTCSINDASGASLAAGANGALFVLTTPDDKKGQTGLSSVGGGEIIEFAPEGAYSGMHSCPSVSGSVNVDSEEAKAPEDGGPLTATAYAHEVTTFDAITLDRKVGWAPPVELTSGAKFAWNTVEWQPFAFEWDFDVKAGGYTDQAAIEETPSGSGEYRWPSPEATHEYTTPGTYEAELRLYGDFGTKEIPFDVKVLAAEKPKASFTCEPSGLTVNCDASASTPTPGAEIGRYEWTWEEGGKAVNIATPKTQHSYGAAGTYKVTLVVHDDEGAESTSEPYSQEVTVKSEETTTTTSTTNTPITTTTTNAPITTTTTTTTSTKASGTTTKSAVGKPKSETEKEKLAKALKVCHKDRSKKQRVSCEKRAKAKYAQKKKAGQKKTSKKKAAKKK